MPKPRRKPALRVYWSKRERDVMYGYDHGARGCDARLLHNALSHPRPLAEGLPAEARCLLDELDRRGFDLKTLRFSICRKEQDAG